MQYFIWEDDELTDALTEILKERVQAGVEVRFLYDYLGSKPWKKDKLEALVPLGAKVSKDVVSISHLNYRDHRKIVVIDGEVGYTGGYNVGQEYVDGGERFAVWRDTHVRVTGQVVGELEALFAARWFDQTKEDVVHGGVPPRPAGRRQRRVRHPLPGDRAVRRGPVAVVTPRPHGGGRQRRAPRVDPVALLHPRGRALRHDDQRAPSAASTCAS